MEAKNWHYIPGDNTESVLFHIVSNDLHDAPECTLRKFADDTDLGGVIDIAEGGAAIQRDHNRLEKCDERTS